MTEPVAGQPVGTARDWKRIGLWLVGGTLAYNVAEGVIAVWAGAEAVSIALLGFGLDSFIECAAALVVFWRLWIEAQGADPRVVERSERRVHQFVGATFFLLALYVVAQASLTLWQREPPAPTLIGIVLTAASLVVMPLLSWGKLHAARQVGSAALRSEAKETLACSFLSATVLIGLAGNALAGWWWADPVAALAMVPWLLKEGREGLRGEACCA
jgi:divalent metal cation (Fe/Co/Zn/Cd) transporter